MKRDTNTPIVPESVMKDWGLRTTKRPTQKDLDLLRDYAMNHMVSELAEATLRIVNFTETTR